MACSVAGLEHVGERDAEYQVCEAKKKDYLREFRFISFDDDRSDENEGNSDQGKCGARKVERGVVNVVFVV